MKHNNFYVLGIMLIALFEGATIALAFNNLVDKIFILVVGVVLTIIFSCGYYSDREL